MAFVGLGKKMRMKSAQVLVVPVLVLLMVELATAPVHAGEQPLMRVVLLRDLIPEFAQQLLPMPLGTSNNADGSEPRTRMVGFEYCGSDGQGGANAIGILSPANTLLSLISSDCGASLPTIAHRVINSTVAPDWIEIVKGRVTWRPWQLSFDFPAHATMAKPGINPPASATLPQSQTYPTSGLKILPPPGDQYSFDAAVGFRGATIVVALFPTGRAADPLSALNADSRLDAEISSAPAAANIVADAQDSFINDLLKLYAPQYELPIPVQGTTQTMTARNVRIAGSDNLLTATGQISSGDIVYNTVVRCEGADLTVRQITLEPLSIDCQNDDLIERLKCQGQQAVMAGSSSAVGTALTNYYQGQNFHYSALAHPIQFELGDREFSATFEALQSSSRGTSISEAGRISIRRTSSN